MKRPQTIAKQHLIAARNVIMTELVRRVTKILEGKNACIGFTMGMGMFSFDYSYEQYGPDPSYTDGVYDLVEEFDDVLNLTGTSMKLALNERGKVLKVK